MMAIGAFLRRHLLVILFGAMIALQAATLFQMIKLREIVDYYGCGTRTIPCKTIVLPDR